MPYVAGGLTLGIRAGYGGVVASLLAAEVMQPAVAAA